MTKAISLSDTVFQFPTTAVKTFRLDDLKVALHGRGFPDRFGCIQDSRAFCQSFFRWYNEEHRHSGVGLLTPAMVHYGQAENILRQRQDVLDVAYQRHPERFVRSAPKPPQLPSEVWINKPVSTPEPSTLEKRNAPEQGQKQGCCGSTELAIVVARRSWSEISL